MFLFIPEIMKITVVCIKRHSSNGMFLITIISIPVLAVQVNYR